MDVDSLYQPKRLEGNWFPPAGALYRRAHKTYEFLQQKLPWVCSQKSAEFIGHADLPI